LLSRQLDRENLGLIKRYQFQEMLDARFGVKLTKGQISEMVRKIGAETNDGLVSYGRFLEEFSSHRYEYLHLERKIKKTLFRTEAALFSPYREEPFPRSETERPPDGPRMALGFGPYI
jgi:hypothetical protein